MKRKEGRSVYRVRGAAELIWGGSSRDVPQVRGRVRARCERGSEHRSQSLTDRVETPTAAVHTAYDEYLAMTVVALYAPGSTSEGCRG